MYVYVHMCVCVFGHADCPHFSKDLLGLPQIIDIPCLTPCYMVCKITLATLPPTSHTLFAATVVVVRLALAHNSLILFTPHYVCASLSKEYTPTRNNTNITRQI